MLTMKKQIEELTGMVMELRSEVVRNQVWKEEVESMEREMGDRMKKMEDNTEELATRVVGVEKGLKQMSMRLDGVARGVGHLESEVATVRTTTTDTNNKLDLLLQRTGRGDMEHQGGGVKPGKGHWRGRIIQQKRVAVPGAGMHKNPNLGVRARTGVETKSRRGGRGGGLE